MVLEAARYRFVKLVQRAQCRVAVDQCGNNQPETIDVGHLGKTQVLLVHLAVDREQRFLAPRNTQVHTGGGKRGFQFALHFMDQIAPATTRFFYRLGKNTVAPRVQVSEGQILQFAVNLVQAKPMRNRRVYVQRLG